MGRNFRNIGIIIQNELERVTSTLNKRRRTFPLTSDIDQDSAVDTEHEEHEEKNASTQFFPSQRNKLFKLQQHFERYVNTLPKFDFNSAKYYLILMKSYFIIQVVKENEIEPTVLKKANKFVSYKFGNVQSVDIMTFFGGATSHESFVKA